MNTFGECGVVSIHIPIPISGIKNIIRNYVSDVNEELKNVKKIMLKQLVKNTERIKKILDINLTDYSILVFNSSLMSENADYITNQLSYKNIKIGNVLDFSYTDYVIYSFKLDWDMSSYRDDCHDFINIDYRNYCLNEERGLKNNKPTNKCYSYH